VIASAVADPRPAPLPSPATAWGWLPVVSVVTACGLLAIAVADTGARSSAAWAYPLFWAGLLGVFVPVAARLISSGAGRQERISLVLLLGIALYVVKVLYLSLIHI